MKKTICAWVIAIIVCCVAVYNSNIVSDNSNETRGIIVEQSEVEESDFSIGSLIIQDEQENTDVLEYSEEIYYRTLYGKCYHKEGCGSLYNSEIPISLEDAQDEGLRACKRCYD